MNLQQRKVLIDGLIQTQARHQRMNRANAPKAKGTALFRRLVMKVDGLKHRFGLIGPRLGLQSLLQFSLALRKELFAQSAQPVLNFGSAGTASPYARPHD